MVSIYCVHNLDNGKVYIGKTIKPIAERWKEHVRYANRGSNWYLSNAIRKHGKDSFVVSPLGWAATQDKASIWERLYILSTDARNPEKGYNLTRGGDGGGANQGHKHSEQTKKKISLAKTGVPNINGRGIVRNAEWLRKHSEATTRKDIRNDEIALLYRQGFSLNAIAERYAASPEIIRLRLKKVGVTMRPRGHQKKNQGETSCLHY